MPCRTLALCLVLIGATLFAVDTVRADDEAIEVAVLDVSDLLRRNRSTHAPILDLWPSNYAPHIRNPRNQDRKPAFVEEGSLQELIRQSVDPSSWDEVDGAELRLRGGRLRVRNRPAQVARVREYIAALRADAGRRVSVQLGVRRGAPAFPGPATAATQDESASLELVPYVGRGVEVVERSLYVQDYEVEIAQGSVIANPVRLDILSGLAAELMAAPTIKGDQIVLSGVVQHAQLGEIRRVETGIDEEYLARPYRSDERLRNGIVELPTLQATAVVFNTVVPRAERLRIPVAYGPVQKDIWLKADLTSDARTAPGLLPLGGLRLRSYEAFVGWQNDQMSWRSAGADLPLLTIPTEGDERDPEQAEDLLEDLRDQVLPVDSNARDQAHVPHPDRISLVANAKLTEQARAHLIRAEQALLRGANVDVRVLSVTSDRAPAAGAGQRAPAEGAELLAAGRVPTLHGRRSALLAGTLAAFLSDYDVEVAQEARIADPIVDICFDGLALNLRPLYPQGSEFAELTLQLLFSTQRVEPEAYKSGTRYLGPLDRVTGAVRQFETSLRVNIGGTHLIDAGMDPRRGGRRLVIELSVQPR